MWAEGVILVLQMFCCGEACLRGMWWRALYWFGALLLTVAIVRGLKS